MFFSTAWADKLHEAVQENDIARVKSLISKSVAINDLGEDGRSALYLAAQEGYMPILKVLVHHGADVNTVSVNDDDSTPLIIAAFRGHADVVNFLSDYPVNINSKDSDGYTALSWAWENEYTDIVQALIKKGANLNVLPVGQEKSGSTFLHLALNNNDYELTRLLITHGADYYAQNKWGNTPLCYAGKSYEVIQTLIEHGANFREKHGTCNPLFSAVSSGNIETIKLLLKLGAGTDVNTNSINDGTVLYTAIDTGNSEIVELLLKHGADPNTLKKRNNKRTVLYTSTDEGKTEIVGLLLKHGADPNIPDVTGITPLHRAARRGNIAVVKMLLTHGANINAKGVRVTLKGKLVIMSSPGYTPLHAAADKGKLDIVKILVEHGADLNAKATGRIFIDKKDRIIRYENLTPLGIAQLHEKYNPLSRKAIVNYLIGKQ